MKRALALETSGPVASVALLEGDGTAPSRVVAQETVGDGMKHGVDLFPAVARVLAAAGLDARDLDLVAVGTGPGSYTGLRVGVTAARALAYAIGAELLGVPSCDAWARGARSVAEVHPPADTEDHRLANGDAKDHLAVVTDARVRAVYLSIYRRTPCANADADQGAEWSRVEGPEILEPPAASERIPAGAILLGDAAHAYPEFLGRFRHREDPPQPHAADVGRMALRRHLGGERARIDAVHPLYLRKSEAERRWEQLHG